MPRQKRLASALWRATFIDWLEQQAGDLQEAGEQRQLAAKKQEVTFAEALQYEPS